MPNWCSNHIEVRGSNQAEIKRLVDAFNERQFCETVIPLPEGKEHYDFCVQNWGTKWDVEPYEFVEVDDDGLGFSANFDSAWSPPIGVAQRLVEQGLEVVLRYHESGMCFVGHWDNGFDECYTYSGESANTVRQAIGDELDDFFGISEMLAEYEDEEEELTVWIKEGVENRANV